MPGKVKVQPEKCKEPVGSTRGGTARVGRLNEPRPPHPRERTISAPTRRFRVPCVRERSCRRTDAGSTVTHITRCSVALGVAASLAAAFVSCRPHAHARPPPPPPLHGATPVAANPSADAGIDAVAPADDQADAAGATETPATPAPTWTPPPAGAAPAHTDNCEAPLGTCGTLWNLRCTHDCQDKYPNNENALDDCMADCSKNYDACVAKCRRGWH